MISPDDAYRAAAHHLNAGRDEDMFLDYLTEDAKNVLWNRLARERLEVEAKRQKNGEIIFAIPGPLGELPIQDESLPLGPFLDERVRASPPAPPELTATLVIPQPALVIPQPDTVVVDQGADLHAQGATGMEALPPGRLVFHRSPPSPAFYVHVLRVSMDGTCYVNEKKCETDADVLDGLRFFLLSCVPTPLPDLGHSLRINSGIGENGRTGGRTTLSAPSSSEGRQRFVDAMRHLRQLADA